jgi:class II lanthipeptide synthase
MSAYRDQVADAIDAVTILGPLRYSWLGRRNRAPSVALRDELDRRARGDYLLGCLREELYWSFYCRGGVVPARWGEPQPVAADAALATAIADAITRRGGWEPGWTVERVDGDEAVVTSPRLRVRAPAAACRAARVAVEPGATVSLPIPAELPGLSPGFVTIVGDAGDEGDGGMVRVYWHVTRAGAPAVVRALTARLNAETVPFSLKVADHPLRFDRCDAAVLYLRLDGFEAVRPFLAALARDVAGFLRPRVPAFTFALAPGVGLAEGSRAGESFGARRCALLAAGIVGAYERGEARPAGWLEAAVASFASVGVEIDAPYREPSLAGRHVL